ncbi:MAG: hypothetical protein IKZ49_01705 [Alphaproteobacteria bacterium]|nr:hypothetical protein [Alphaproteobacteria bacterium]
MSEHYKFVINDSIRNHVFNYIVSMAADYQNSNLKKETITRNTQLEYDLDMGYLSVMFFILDLEKLTMLDLNTGVSLDDIYTIGDVCDLITSKLQTANKTELLNQVSKKPIDIQSFSPKIQPIVKPEQHPCFLNQVKTQQIANQPWFHQFYMQNQKM